MSLPLNLIIFCTTMPKQCYGENNSEHTYDQVIESLFNKVNGNLFKNRILHLKSRSQEHEVAKKIKDFCVSKNIRVLETKQNVEHHSENIQNHSAEYFKDIYKAFSDPEVRKTRYSLWLEDDFIFKEGKITLRDSFDHALKYLEKNPDQLTVRYNQSNHSTNALEDYRDKDYFHHSDEIYVQGEKYTPWGPTFTFQPNISRTCEIFASWKLAQQYLDKLGSYHCELMSGDLLKNFTLSKTPFSFFNPEKIYAEHIG